MEELHIWRARHVRWRQWRRAYELYLEEGSFCEVNIPAAWGEGLQDLHASGSESLVPNPGFRFWVPDFGLRSGFGTGFRYRLLVQAFGAGLR